MIYPAEELTELVGKSITGLKFYTDNDVNFSGGKLNISMGTTTTTGFAFTVTRIEGLTQVVNGMSVTSGASVWEITLDNPFTYTGDNLVLDFELTQGGSYGSTSFLGVSTSNYGASYYTGQNGKTRGQFLPKVTFVYGGGEPVVEPAATVNPESLAFGNVLVNTTSAAQTVTLTNTGEVAFTPAFSLTDGFATTATQAEIAVGGSMQIPVTFTPTQEGEYNGTLTITSGNRAVLATVELIGTGIDEIPDYAVTVTPDGGTLNFGTVDYEENATKSMTITVTNTGLQPVTPTLSALSAPFSTDYVATELAAGESVTITITFTPTEENTYNANATLSFGNGIADRTFTLTGKGGKYSQYDHQSIYDITYDWVDKDGKQRQSNLNDIATETNQIIAMLREVYMNQNVPGSIIRGYKDDEASAAVTSQYRDKEIYPEVSYQAVGWLNSNHEYVDQYGWNIPPKNPIKSIVKGSRTYYYFDPEDYKPVEGLTLIMLELKDGMNLSGSTDYSNVTSNYSLTEMIETTFKSARIISSYKDIDDETNPGRLFKIDADKLNRFIFLSKGKMRMSDMSQNVWTTSNYWWEPSIYGSTNTDNDFGTGTEAAVMAPFYHMFEEFSPEVANNNSSGTADHYQELINMEEFYVKHDCTSAAYQGGHHEFNMYGFDSQSEDCQDIRDMMFFVPTYRLTWWFEGPGKTTRRDPNERFVNYHPDYLPTLSLYVIHQYPITGEKQTNADVYDLNLSWTSNILKYLPQDESEYDVYRVETQADGTKRYVLVTTISTGDTTCVDHVDMQQTGRVVTYVIQGKDKTGFLSLQMSNEESYIIPGTDPNELMSLDVRATHYSRFDPQTEKNFYSNTLKLKNNVGTSVTADMLTTGAQFVFNRMYTDAQNVAHTDVVATATVTSNNGSHVVLSIAMQNQRELSEYPYGYRANKGEATFTITNGVVDFTDCTIYDNFGVSVEGNQHPAMYKYKVLFGEKHSNEIGVMVHKTDMEMIAHDQETVDADVLHNEEILNRAFNIDVKYSSKTEILRYDAYRWRNDEEMTETRKIIESGNSDGTEEEDVAPNGIAGNQATFYTIAMTNDYTGSVNVSQTAAIAKAKFVDNIATQTWGAYVLAPVVETFTGRDDYNTYGGPLQGTATSSMQITVKGTREMSEFNWTDKSTNKVYCYYTIPLEIANMKVPDGYNVYKLRAWRKVDTNLLQELEEDRQYRLGVNGDYMFDEVTYPSYDKNANYEIGSPIVEDYQTTTTPAEIGYELKATFGAQKVSDGTEAGTITQLPMEFVVRAYYTKEANLAQPNGMRAPRRVDGANNDGKYYIMEQTIPFTLVMDENLVTSVHGVYADKQVEDVIYYNMMGQSSSTPFSGVNVMVTRYTDGSYSTVKVHK